MKLTWHIVAKDLRRLQVPLVLWVLLFVGEFAVGIRVLHGDHLDGTWFGRLQMLTFLLQAIRAVLGYLLVAAVIFEDTLVETTAFWPTRPISGGRLLAAKLIFCLVVLGIIPVLVTLPWWLYCGLGVHEIGQATHGLLGIELLPAAVAMALAVLCGTMSRFVTGTLLVAAVAAIALATLVLPEIHLRNRWGGSFVVSSSLADARTEVLYRLALGCCAVVIAHQFLTRRLVRSVILLVCAAGLLLAEAAWWPWQFTEHFEPDGAGAPYGAPVIPMKVELASALLHEETDIPGAHESFVSGLISIQDVPADVHLRYDRPDFEFRWADGTTSRAHGSLFWGEYPGSNYYQVIKLVPTKEPRWWELTPTFRRLRNEGKAKSYEDYLKSENESTERTFDFVVEVPPSVGARMVVDPPTCTLRLSGDQLQAGIAPELAISEGNTWRRKDEFIRIARRELKSGPRGSFMEVTVVEHRFSMGAMLNADFTPATADPFEEWYAINRSEGDASGTNGDGPFSMRVASVVIEWKTLAFAGPFNLMGDPANWDHKPVANGNKWGSWIGPTFVDWFSHTTLARVEDAPAGRFSRQVSVERLKVELEKPDSIHSPVN